jgi:DNA segregation ATPase FtsK/SpoIIIE-like protein
VAQEANLLLDRLVRQGRAFGIHAIMGSQTLDGAYTLNRSTMGQMAVRVALQCSEADSYIILNEDNAAARLLSRPGEAIYNDAAGKVEGNSPFQIVWLDERKREKLLAGLVSRDGTKRDMVVYEGNQPVHLHENDAFQKVNADGKKVSFKAWLGGAMAIKEDTSATFRIASGSNLLIVGQQDETTTSLVANAMCSLGKQSTFSNTSLTLLDGTPGDSPHATVLKEVAETIGCAASIVGIREVEQAMQDLYAQLQQRMTDGAADLPTVFLVINALHRFRDLRRNEDDFGFSTDEDKQKTPSQILAELIKEGPPLGMHVIIATDTLANLTRAFDRQGIREFDMRVLLQMGGNDSTNLIDSPDASRLGMHRALLYSEETGTIEPFRPYALPDLSALASSNA